VFVSVGVIHSALMWMVKLYSVTAQVANKKVLIITLLLLIISANALVFT
jgi:hypothetical protein